MIRHFVIDLQIDADGSGYISVSELGDAFASVGLKLPAYEIRDFIAMSDTKIKDEKLDFEEFLGVKLVTFGLSVLNSFQQLSVTARL